MSMMSTGVSGMLAQSTKLNVISNNIANSDTLSYKSQSVTFAEAYIEAGTQATNGNIAQSGTGVNVAAISSDWTTGAVDVTNQESNLMIAGDGFFQVALNGETYYTRAGDFSLVKNPAVGGSGFVMMRPNGAVLQGYDSTAGTYGPVTFTAYDSTGAVVNVAPTSYSIAADGTITAKPDATSNPHIVVSNSAIKVQRFNNPDSLTQTEGEMYQTTNKTSYSTTTPSTPGQNGTGTITQGALEGSNTDLIIEFTNMITSQRAFQANSKVITTADEILQTVMGLKR